MTVLLLASAAAALVVAVILLSERSGRTRIEAEHQRALARTLALTKGDARRAAAETALAELRRARDAGEFNADEETIVARMERLAASRPRPEGRAT